MLSTLLLSSECFSRLLLCVLSLSVFLSLLGSCVCVVFLKRFSKTQKQNQTLWVNLFESNADASHENNAAAKIFRVMFVWRRMDGRTGWGVKEWANVRPSEFEFFDMMLSDERQVGKLASCNTTHNNNNNEPIQVQQYYQISKPTITHSHHRQGTNWQTDSQ